MAKDFKDYAKSETREIDEKALPKNDHKVINEITTKKVKNRSGHKIELSIGGRIVVFPIGSTVEVSNDAHIPTGIGLQVR